ncbi:MAG: WecB/TagA/CpsF family glycosyltransferase [Bacteroidetes bacterium]|nr:WecB/TagA/CpsF family glycosyltransferase [Bacteroidota bacterium]
MEKRTRNKPAREAKMTSGLRTHSLFAVRVQNAPYEHLLAAARAAVAESPPRFTTYSHFSVLLDARRYAWLRALLNRAAVNVADGIGLRLALRLLGARALAPVNATDFHHALLDDCLQRGERIYLLGGSAAAAAALPGLLAIRHPACEVLAHDGSIAVDDAALIESIRDFAPDVLFLGLGSPLQFEWIERNLDDLGIPLTVATGNFLEFLAGTRPRASRWMRAAGLEWLHRLAVEPSRLWRRYLLGIPRFVALVIRERLLK